MSVMGVFPVMARKYSLRFAFIIAGVTACAVSGCVSGAASLLHAQVTGDRDHVVITGEKDSAAALALAVAHCSSYGRSARPGRRSAGAMVYDCVAAR